MCKKLVLLMVLLGLLLCPASHAASIIWVSQAYDTDGDGVQDDLAAEDFVRSLGYDLDVQRGNWTALDAAKIAAFDAADLIIFSRSTNSADYANDATEIAQWNSITTPIINMTAYTARANRWQWVNSDTVNNLTGPAMDVLLPEHPIFTGVTLGASNQVQLVDGTTGTGQTSFIGTLNVGSGTVLVSTGTSTCIAEWPAGEPYYAGAGTPASNRMLFCMGTQESGATPQGAFNLTDTGKAVFANAILYMMGVSIEPGRAASPTPEDGKTDVPRDVVLGWTPGEAVATQDVYFGASLDEVEAASRANPMGVLVSQGQSGATYAPDGLLDFSQTYYWRVDGFEADGVTMYVGNVWSFTTEPVAYAIEGIVATTNGVSEEGSGPERTIDGSGLNADDQHSTEAGDMWLAGAPADETLWIQYEFDKVYKLYELLVWNYNVMFEPVLGFGLKDVTIEYSADGAEWMVLGDAEFARATARADYAANTVVDMQGVAAKSVRLSVNSGHGMLGQYGLSEVSFTYIPVQAREPQPADGATDVDPAAALSWRAGREATSHEVHFGTDPEDLPLVGSPAQAAFTPAALDFGTTYYWRIDEVGDEVWAGEPWSFSTLEFALIEGFETYTDDIDAGEAIFDTWIDGWVNNTGSTVGYLETPFAERTIVRSGRQSMPLFYDNTSSPFYSETSRTFATPQNWTGNGADTLRLFVAGQAPAFVEAADGAILMNGIGTDIWDAADQFRYAHKNLSGSGSITARVEYLDASANSWVKVGVMIRQNAEAGAVNVFMALTGGDGGGATFQQRMTAGGASVSQHTYADGPLAPPYWVRVTREGNTLMGYTSPDGENWTQRGDTITLAMADPVLIGLAVTSHNANQATSAEFSNVAFTGNVTGNWQIGEIGATQPAGNAVSPLYVMLKDAAGQTAVVTHPNGNIVGRSGWNEWQIPMSDFAGVNLSRVDTMAIGVGSRTSPTAGGAGTIYVDDIGFGKPAAE
ncbi:hypothetical protein [Anaerobaca lacustris]|uniref:F5/8 type C domain-containing protein n=1 Tax=Anaerobaca lacustris TaxID=3044600 RepID=A0AAW6TWF2_9BACT|nr:hypothetical protein [Sedimentisphaerales bacterium M17dextr]